LERWNDGRRTAGIMGYWNDRRIKEWNNGMLE